MTLIECLTCAKEHRQLAEWLKELKENKDVLDKIRAEIEEQKGCRFFDDDDMCIYKAGLIDALEIIDKYREGSDKA